MFFENISGCQVIFEFNVRLLEIAWSRVISFEMSGVILQDLFHSSQWLVLKHAHSLTCMYTQEPKTSGGSSVSQNKLPQLFLGYIYIFKYLQSNFIG